MSFNVCKYTGVFKRRMLEVKKNQRDAKNFTLYRTVLLRVISVMNIFPHLIAPLKGVGPHSSKSANMHRLASLLSKYSQQFKIPKHRFEQRQNAPFSFIAFIIFPSFSTYKNTFQNAQQCTFQCPQFQNFLSSANFGLQVRALGNTQTQCHL